MPPSSLFFSLQKKGHPEFVVFDVRSNLKGWKHSLFFASIGVGVVMALYGGKRMAQDAITLYRKG